jgi:hypothetical protein
MRYIRSENIAKADATDRQSFTSNLKPKTAERKRRRASDHNAIFVFSPAFIIGQTRQKLKFSQRRGQDFGYSDLFSTKFLSRQLYFPTSACSGNFQSLHPVSIDADCFQCVCV